MHGTEVNMLTSLIFRDLDKTSFFHHSQNIRYTFLNRLIIVIVDYIIDILEDLIVLIFFESVLGFLIYISSIFDAIIQCVAIYIEIDTQKFYIILKTPFFESH